MKQRKKLVYKLEKKCLKWQSQVKRRQLINLLKNKKAVIVLLKFLKTIGIEERKKVRMS